MAHSRPSTSRTGLHRSRICAARQRLSSRQAALPHGHPIHARMGSVRAPSLPVQARSRPSTSRAACATRASAELVSDSTAGSRRGCARAGAIVSPDTSVPTATSALQTPRALHRVRHSLCHGFSVACHWQVSLQTAAFLAPTYAYSDTAGSHLTPCFLEMYLCIQHLLFKRN